MFTLYGNMYYCYSISTSCHTLCYNHLFKCCIFYLTISEELKINHFLPEVKENLVQIADWLIAHNEEDFMNVFL